MNWTLLQLVVDSSMFSLIWVVQLIIYPSFQVVERSLFKDWHEAYIRKITYIVGPAMLVQVISHGAEVFAHTGVIPIVQTCLILVIWVQTFIVVVPLHQNLDEDATRDEMRQLVRTNWLRTIGWSFIWLISLFRTFYFII